MFFTPAMLAIVRRGRPRPAHRHWLTRPLIAYLHLRQPIARGWARYSVRLKAKVLGMEVGGFERTSNLPVDPSDGRTLRYWSKVRDRLDLLRQIKRQVRSAGWRMRVDSGWHGWDMEFTAADTSRSA